MPLIRPDFGNEKRCGRFKHKLELNNLTKDLSPPALHSGTVQQQSVHGISCDEFACCNTIACSFDAMAESTL